MKLYSSGEVANLLGIHRDKVVSSRASGSPTPKMFVGNRILYTEDDIQKLCAWLEEKGIEFTWPTFKKKSASVVA